MDLNTPWIKWLEKEISNREGWGVKSFDMPNSKHPRIEEWVQYLRDNIKEIDEETYFVGHSIGCQTIMRFLEKSHKNLKIAGCVFVAPWLDLIGLAEEELEIAHPWISNKIDFDRVLDHVGNIVCIFSSNDSYVSEEEQKKFEDNLHAKIIIKQDMEHFEEVKRIPEILEVLR